MAFLIWILAAYLLGSIPFGLLVGKWVKGVDLREHGSRNIGTTNAFRVIGKKWGLVVFLLDAAKGFLAVRLPTLVLSASLSLPQAVLLAAAAILGHAYPCWLKFKGGKGVATSLGVFLAVAFKPTLISFILWCLIFAASRIVSMASLAAALCFPIAVRWTTRSESGTPWLFTISIVLCLFIFYTHRANIGRIVRGEEKRLF